MRSVCFAFFAVSALAGCGSPELAEMVGDDAVDNIETVTSGLTSSSAASTWFPLQAGNTWSFVGPGGQVRTVSLSNVRDGIAQVNGLYPSPLLVGVPNGSSTTLLAYDGSAWVTFVRFGSSATSWSYGENLCTGATLRRSSTGSTVVTPAGAFSDTRSISFMQKTSPSVLCSPLALLQVVFEANVGLVAFTTGRGERFVLSSATVGGRRVPGATGSGKVEASVALDKSAYVSEPNTIRCTTEPCPTNEKTAVVKANFTVANNSSVTQRWEFATSCQFDLEVVSSTGIALVKLSTDRQCPMAPSTLTLAPRQQRTFTGEVTLLDRTGLQLDGAFTLRARLIPRGGSAAPIASAPFTVRIAETR